MTRGSDHDAGLELIKMIKTRFGFLPPTVIFSGTGQRYKSGKDAKKEGALLVTNDPYEVEDTIREIISSKEYVEN